MAQPRTCLSIPKTIVLDGNRLSKTREQLLLGDATLNNTLKILLKEANFWLTQGPWTVTSKKFPSPSFDKHDYVSQAPYWWRSPDSEIYIRRDGVHNPECDKYTDKLDKSKVFQSSYILSLAWYYTGDSTYSNHASIILRTWFIDPSTRMNPHLNHAQLIPNLNTGRCIGIIDFSQAYTSVLDAVETLNAGAPGWTVSDSREFQEWNRCFLDWLVHSTFGIEESAQHNNHGMFAAMQKAAIALFVGDLELVKREVFGIRERIDREISSDGAQTFELERTRSWHYSAFNLVALTRLAAIGNKVGIDLWEYRGEQGQSLHDAVDFLLPSAMGEKKWEFEEKDFKPYAVWDVVQAAAEAGNGRAKRALQRIPEPPGGSLWVLRPAPEQLDAVTR